MSTTARKTDRERTILQAYFGQPSSALADAIATFDLDRPARNGGSPTEVDAAVAGVLLQGIRSSLPQWAAIRSDGQLMLGRSNTDDSRTRFRPQHLFTLNWADSAPGYSWPVAHHATVVREFNRVVITASADCLDTYGYTDFALASFDVNRPLLDGAHEVIVNRWRRRSRAGPATLGLLVR
jgi:hypothetical protein